MLSYTTKTEYGIPALLELARCQGAGLTQLRTVAERRGIPVKYLEQIFAALNKADLVKGVRGQRGGYELSRRAEEITLWEVLQVLEGRGQAADELEARQGVLRELYRRAENRIADVFNVSLAELSRLQQEHEASATMYFI